MDVVKGADARELDRDVLDLEDGRSGGPLRHGWRRGRRGRGYR
jgi:hypothetical protein